MAQQQRPPTRKKRRKPESAAETLEQIESAGERIAAWVAENAVVILAVGAIALILAAGFGYWTSRSDTQSTLASQALARAHNDYRNAFGAKPGDLILTEPANPEIAKRVRVEYLARFQQVAADHPGTAEAGVAALEAGTLQRALGQRAEAEETWRTALPDAAGRDPLHGLLLVSLAGARENAGDWPAAVALYEQAGRLPDFPMAAQALADAARAAAMAGDRTRAIALYDQAVVVADGRLVAPHIQSRVEELRALTTP